MNFFMEFSKNQKTFKRMNIYLHSSEGFLLY